MRNRTRILVLSGILLGLGGVLMWLSRSEAPITELSEPDTFEPEAARTAWDAGPTTDHGAVTRADALGVQRHSVVEPVKIPGGSGEILRIQVRDPHAVLGTEHWLEIQAERYSYPTPFLRDGDELLTRAQIIFPPPDMVRLMLRTRADRLVLAESAVSVEADGSYAAEFDLVHGLATVEIRLTGPESLLALLRSECSVISEKGESTILQAERAADSLLRLSVPIPNRLLVRLIHPVDRGNQANQLTLQREFRIEKAEHQSFEIAIPTGSLRVRLSVAPEKGEGNKSVIQWYTASLHPSFSPLTAWREPLRLSEAGEAYIPLLAPGLYRFEFYGDMTRGRTPILVRDVLIGEEELLLTLDPAQDRSVVEVQFEAGERTMLRLTSGSFASSGLHEIVDAGADRVRFTDLEPGEWRAVAQRGNRIAYGRVDTRSDPAGVIRLQEWQEWQELRPLKLRFSPSLTSGLIQVSAWDAAGRVHFGTLDARTEWTLELQTIPGPLSVSARHSSGMLATTEIMVKDSDPDEAGQGYPLEFRQP